MHRTGHREKKEAVVPRRERKIEKKRERRASDGAWREKKKLRCPAESEKLRRKGKEENQTGHGEGKEAEMPRRG